MPTTELVISLGSGNPNDAGISGPQSEAFIIERTALDELIGIHFEPGGVFPFLKFPSGELHDQHLLLADVWNHQQANDLVCLLHEADSVDDKFGVLEKWLLSVARRPLKYHPAVKFAMNEFQKDPGLFSSGLMANRVGFSQRHFIQLFHDQVGLTPKLFCRVERFQKVIRSVQKARAVDWVDVALSCGYFDQAHFNHDFRKFSGLTPTEYFSLRTEHMNHVQVL
jgi:AraC-like DNA-binding protein